MKNIARSIAASLPLMGAILFTPAQAEPEKSVVHIPATAIFATENNGRFAVITDTGRFIIQGTIYDVWDQREISTLEQARHAATHIPLQKANVGFDDLSPIVVGKGSKAVYMFSDMQCSHCKTIINDARRTLPEDYRLEIIMLPLLGPESAQRSKEILCAATPSEGWQAAVSGDMASPITQKESCDTDVLERRMVTAQFIGARNVPFLIRDDGLVQQGSPADGFRAWLLANR